MSSTLAPAAGTRHTGTLAETQIATGNAVLLGIYPAATTTGTLKISTGLAGASTELQTVAIGLLPAGKTFGPYGIKCPGGITADLSNAGDDVVIAWMPV